MLLRKGVIALALAFVVTGCAKGAFQVTKSGGGTSGNGIKITKPVPMAQIRGPVEVCMNTSGYDVEPAKKGVNAGKGHHHLLIDAYLPKNLNKPIAKDANHVHMGDGSKCKTLELSSGPHTITAVFAKGNHVPYDPPVTDAVIIFVGNSN